MSRTDDLAAFIAHAGWADAAQSIVAGDASNRRYDRLRRADWETAIVMDAPPDRGEDVRPFVSIAQHLRACGLSAPQIIAQDAARGFLLLEDLGDDVFARVLERDGALENRLYSAAIDVLVHLHRQPAPDLAAYDAAVMTPLALLAFDWYADAAGACDASARSRAEDEVFRLLEPVSPSVLIQRDYHAENLIWLPERPGARAVGLLDFQDAMLGHPAYDLCSILLDARRDVSLDVQDAMLARYISGAGITDEAAFRRAYWALALQRNLRIVGVFARLCVRDGKPHYLGYLPRVWRYVEAALEALNDPALTVTIKGALPAPTEAICERIKAQCATRPTR